MCGICGWVVWFLSTSGLRSVGQTHQDRENSSDIAHETSSAPPTRFGMNFEFQDMLTTGIVEESGVTPCGGSTNHALSRSTTG